MRDLKEQGVSETGRNRQKKRNVPTKKLAEGERQASCGTFAVFKEGIQHSIFSGKKVLTLLFTMQLFSMVITPAEKIPSRDQFGF